MPRRCPMRPVKVMELKAFFSPYEGRSPRYVMDFTTKFLSGLRAILDDEQVPEVDKEILKKYFRRAAE